MKMKNKTKLQSKFPIHEATHEAPSGKFWTMRIEPGEPAVIGEKICQGIMVMKNHGPGTIVVDTGHGYENVKLLPGRVQVIATYNKVEVMTIDASSALLEFEYVPKFRLK
jgi:hypothetical protein